MTGRGLAAPAPSRKCLLGLYQESFDWAFPPPATMMMNDIPAFTSGTVASMVDSFTNLKSILAGLPR